MSKLFFAPLPHRGFISVSGDDRASFLQGLVSNDVTKASASRGLYGAFLTAQGKFLHEFFLAEVDGALLIETEAARRGDFAKRLALYKLRAKVAISQPEGLTAYALWGEGAAEAVGFAAEAGLAGPFGQGTVLVDPRLAEAGLRAWLPDGNALSAAGFTEATTEAWDHHRIGLGLPDGSRDMEPERALLLENGFDELNGVDFKKGCYLGQEMTARTKYRGLIRKRLMPVEIAGPTPAPGTLILQGESEAGEMRSASGTLGLALLRLEALTDGAPLRAGEALLTPHKPGWAVFSGS